jgi:hypothetical protein
MGIVPYDDVLAYVGSYRNGHGDVAPVDVNGVIHLMLAAVDNLREHMIDADLEQLADAVSASQRETLIRFGAFLERKGSSVRS